MYSGTIPVTTYCFDSCYFEVMKVLSKRDLSCLVQMIGWKIESWYFWFPTSPAFNHFGKHRIYIDSLFFKFFGGYQSFVGPLISLIWPSGDVCPWCQSPAGSLTCVLIICVEWIPQIHLWCDTCWSLDGQYGSWALSIHILAQVYISIGRTRNRDQLCGTACADALPNEPLQLDLYI